jgi:AraC-like DNA-binding protein
MRYTETKPPLSQQSYIESFWRFHAGSAHETSLPHIIVPDGAVSLSYLLLPNKKAFVRITGPSLTAHKTELIPGATYAGIRVRPGTAGSVLGTDILDYRDAFGPQTKNPPKIFELMQAQIPNDLEKTNLHDLLHAAGDLIVDHAGPLDSHVCQISNSIMQADGNANLNQLSDTIDISMRQLRRRFKYQCGLTMKEFSRLRRVRKACIDLVSKDKVSWLKRPLNPDFRIRRI